jgi:hypothetical protein
MYPGQLLELYNCMVFIMHEIRTFLPQGTKGVNELSLEMALCSYFFAGAQNHFIEGMRIDDKKMLSLFNNEICVVL